MDSGGTGPFPSQKRDVIFETVAGQECPGCTAAGIELAALFSSSFPGRLTSTAFGETYDSTVRPRHRRVTLPKFTRARAELERGYATALSPPDGVATSVQPCRPQFVSTEVCRMEGG